MSSTEAKTEEVSAEAGYTKAVAVETKYLPDLVKLLPSQKGKVVVITGTTSGTGSVAASVAADLGAHVVLLNRSSKRAEAGLASLQAKHGKDSFTDVPCDLQDFASVRAAAATISEKFGKEGVDILINNAGVMGMPDKRTKDGFDVQMQTNHLSHFLLSMELMPLLETAAARAGEARVVNHSSLAAHGAPLEAKYYAESKEDELGGFEEGSERFTDPQWLRYHQSKLANQVFTHALNDKLKENKSAVISLVAHPGLASTSLQVTTTKHGGSSGKVMSARMETAQSAEDGTCGILSCAFLKEAEAGQYYGPKGMGGEAVVLPKDPIFIAQDAKDVLWDHSVKATGSALQAK